ncbi:hypothetical protein GT019_10660 [Paenibacillus sp. T1]|uniref:Uncharacterized protein n=1 Tax=Paenibacillus glycinis TaxID=2697035 RepID=A0ABW9XNX8_9BACL|nr:hypothetical protein [Paenibacillus glycinis]NBD24332.1 hypothetical protein [Paenibacillus glycinis]
MATDSGLASIICADIDSADAAADADRYLTITRSGAYSGAAGSVLANAG